MAAAGCHLTTYTPHIKHTHIKKQVAENGGRPKRKHPDQRSDETEREKNEERERESIKINGGSGG